MKTNGRKTVAIEDDDDREAGPELPPDDDEADDEEGRFFGGGLTTDTVEVLDFIDEREKDETAVSNTTVDPTNTIIKTENIT